MEQNSNDRDIYDVSYKISLSKSIILSAISEIGNPLDNKKEYYTKCVIDRFNKCNDNYVKEFDNILQSLILDLDKLDFNSTKMRRFIRLSGRITSEIYGGYVELLKNLQNFDKRR